MTVSGLPGSAGLRVLLVDDNEPFRRRVRKLIGDMPGFDVIGEATNGRMAVRLAEEVLPDIVITDILMRRLNGIEVTRQIKSNQPTTAVIALSMHADDGFRTAMHQAGAATYLLKDNVRHELPKVLRSIAAARRPPAATGAAEA